MKENQVPGMAIAVVKDGKVILAKGYGYRNVKKKLPVTPDTLFAIGSCTKAFTATLLGMLADDGKLDWETPVRDYLPEFKLKDPVAGQLLNTVDLLTHRSGIPRHDMSWYNSSCTRLDLVKRLRHLDSSKTFRSTFQYNNFMFLSAGVLAERLGNASWEELMRKRLLEPLGMTASNFSVTSSQKTQNHALPYSKIDEKLTQIPFRNIDTVGPAGSINSSVNDMTHWLLLNLGKGKYKEKQLVKKATMAKIHAPQMVTGRPLPEDPEQFYLFYGLGWGVTSYRGHVVLRHGGGIDGFLADVLFLPRDNTGIVILTNSDSGSPFSSIVINHVMDRVLGLKPLPWAGRLKKRLEKFRKQAEDRKKKQDKDRKTGTTPSHALSDYEGLYENPGYGVLTVKKEGKGLTVSLNDISYNAGHYHYDMFRLTHKLFQQSYMARFETGKKGDVQHIHVNFEASVNDIRFTRKPATK